MLKDAAIYVPPKINGMSFTRGFTPTQWVLGKTPQQDLSLMSELYNPGVDNIDETTHFANIQQKRLQAGIAFLKADSDAKLRRAMNQKFYEGKDKVLVGQRCWYWRIQGPGHLQKSKWRGPARCVAQELSNDGGKVVVHWLVHGTSLLRCSPAHVRPFTEALREVQGERDHYFTAWREEERQSGTLIETIRKLQQQQAQGRDGQELVAAEVQLDTLNPEVDERNYQCEVLFRPVGSELSKENVSAYWKSWSKMSKCTTGSMWTPSQRMRTAHAAMTADGSNANTFPPMSSATLCTEAWHGTMVDDLGVWPKVVGHSHARTVASRVKRSCASNPERVPQNHCPQTSCVGWEYLLLVAEPVTPA